MPSLIRGICKILLSGKSFYQKTPCGDGGRPPPPYRKIAKILCYNMVQKRAKIRGFRPKIPVFLARFFLSGFGGRGGIPTHPLNGKLFFQQSLHGIGGYPPPSLNGKNLLSSILRVPKQTSPKLFMIHRKLKIYFRPRDS